MYSADGISKLDGHLTDDEPDQIHEQEPRLDCQRREQETATEQADWNVAEAKPSNRRDEFLHFALGAVLDCEQETHQRRGTADERKNDDEDGASDVFHGEPVRDDKRE